MDGNKQRTDWNSQTETKDKVKQAASDVQEKASSVAEDAKRTVAEEARSTFSNQKAEAVNELHGVAEALRMTGDQLRDQDQTMVAQYSNKIADQVDRFSSYLENRSLDEVLHEAEDFARRQPEIFLGGAFTLGLLATRFFKSSSPEPDFSQGYSQSYRSNRWTGQTTTNYPYSPGYDTDFDFDTGTERTRPTSPTGSETGRW